MYENLLPRFLLINISVNAYFYCDKHLIYKDINRFLVRLKTERPGKL